MDKELFNKTQALLRNISDLIFKLHEDEYRLMTLHIITEQDGDGIVAVEINDKVLGETVELDIPIKYIQQGITRYLTDEVIRNKDLLSKYGVNL